MGKGDHLNVVHACSRELGNIGWQQESYWRSIGACHRCGSTRFWESPGGVLCAVCYPPPLESSHPRHGLVRG